MIDVGRPRPDGGATSGPVEYGSKMSKSQGARQSEEFLHDLS